MYNEAMSLISLLLQHFESGVRSRGSQYFQQCRVKVVEETSQLFSTDVRGSVIYEVDIELEAPSGALIGFVATSLGGAVREMLDHQRGHLADLREALARD